ncbi:MAG: ATP-binding protein [Candidatus Latescibacteria bacterium]|nr:ATP-binding protein [Candidatus Latescibacterota bacterium]
MNLFRSSSLSDLATLEQRFQSQLSHEILVSQKLRATVLFGMFAVALLFLFGGEFVVRQIFGADYFPGPVVPFSVVMMVVQLFMWLYIARAIRDEATIPSWVWYLRSLAEITLVTMIFLILRLNYESPTHVLSAPAILVYALFITLSTLRLSSVFALFVGVLAAVQYLAISLFIYGSIAGLSYYTPTYETLYFCFVRASILLLCGVGAAFVARELRRRMLNSYRIIEERNRVEAANQAKSTFLANVSHEIRTPLNAILGYTQLMDVDQSLSVEQHQTIKNISTSGGHLTELINRVLDLSKIEAGREELQSEDFDLQEMISELKTMFQLRCEQKGLDWVVNVDATSMMVQGDVGKLRQVLINLLGNAVKFTTAGRVVLNVSARPDSHFYFEVFDTGPGISQEHQAVIFDPFQQVSPVQQQEGTGLGLAIASGYVEIMGGQLEVASVPEVETRFFFTLQLVPASGDVVNIVETVQVRSLEAGYEVQALVVDDVAENRDILAEILSRVGVDVRQAESGIRALELVKELVPDIVLMDILMPELSGVETMQQLREMYGGDQCKIVAVSASVLEHQRKAYMEAGFDGVIDKPLQMNRVYGMLANLLGVKFVYESDTQEQDVADLSDATLPDSLLLSLEKAAAGYNVTQFNEFLDEAEALGVAEKQLVAPLRSLSARYDMKAALEALKEINHA